MTDKDENAENNYRASVKLMENTRSVANYLFDYYEHVDKQDFNEQFIVNFYYVISEMLGDTEELSVDQAIDMVCDTSLSFLFNIALIFKGFHTKDEHLYESVMSHLKPVVLGKLNDQDSFYKSWGAGEY